MKLSPRQAKLLTFLWHTGQPARVAVDGGWVEPTMRACVRRGWLEPTGYFDTFPSGAPCELHSITEAGFKALARFFDGWRPQP